MWNPDLLSKLGAFVQAPTPFCKNRCLFVPSLRPSDLDRLKQGKKGGQTGCWPVCFHIPYDTPENWGTPKNSLVSFQTSVSDFPAYLIYLGAFLFVEVKILLIGQWTIFNRVHHQAEMGGNKNNPVVDLGIKLRRRMKTLDPLEIFRWIFLTVPLKQCAMGKSSYLLGGWTNPSEKNMRTSNLIISPNRDENKRYLKPQPSYNS